MSNNKPVLPNHSYQNTSTGGIPHYRSPPQVPLTPVVSTWGQSRERPQISQSDILRKKRFEELLVNVEGPLAKRTEVTIHNRSIENASAERPSPGPSTTKLSPHLVRPENLGSRDEALHSHPTRSDARYSPKESPQVDKWIKRQRRKFGIYKIGDDDIFYKGYEPSTESWAEHQQRRIFSTRTSEDNFQEFPDPETWETKEGERKAEKTTNSTIPSIRLIPPSESSVDKADKPYLSVDDAYKNLYRQVKKENRILKRRLGQLESQFGPLAEILCTYEGINCDPNALDVLPSILDKILYNLQRTEFVASYYKRLTKSLECQLRRANDKLLSFRNSGDEDYIR
ncbi:hypothetical protein F4859DRAFT_526733 [Xylaria cf. heliscus]|nr:hypothetical protein F4859DRAFT_526733 [Xylaria cf. heliscus]